jgi:hypothetical protein
MKATKSCCANTLLGLPYFDERMEVVNITNHTKKPHHSRFGRIQKNKRFHAYLAVEGQTLTVYLELEFSVE